MFSHRVQTFFCAGQLASSTAPSVAAHSMPTIGSRLGPPPCATHQRQLDGIGRRGLRLRAAPVCLSSRLTPRDMPPQATYPEARLDSPSAASSSGWSYRSWGYSPAADRQVPRPILPSPCPPHPLLAKTLRRPARTSPRRPETATRRADRPTSLRQHDPAHCCSRRPYPAETGVDFGNRIGSAKEYRHQIRMIHHLTGLLVLYQPP